jgi:hypothetical protein
MTIPDMLLFDLPALRDREGWQVALQATFIEPATATELGSGETLPPGPRANVVVGRRLLTEPLTLEAAIETTRANMLQTVAGLRVLRGPEPFAFDDGGAGLSLDIQFPTSVATLAQVHVLRIDADVLTECVVTVDEASFEDRRDEMLGLVRSFRGRPPLG